MNSRPECVTEVVAKELSVEDRLANANSHFRRMAAGVLGDESAIRLLSDLYVQVNLDIDSFDSGSKGISLAKLAAAHFCEIGAEVIYITEAGQRFIESLHRELEPVEPQG